MASRRKPTRRKQLGLSVADYDSMLAAQGGGCAICGNPPKTRRLDTDHDHRTGQVRGLLCHRCNRALPTWITCRWLGQALNYLARSEPKYAGNYATGVQNSRAELDKVTHDLGRVHEIASRRKGRAAS